MTAANDNLSPIWFNDAPLSFDEAQAVRRWWFEKIAPKDNWKMSIKAEIFASDFDNCNQAAIYFTGAGIEKTADTRWGYIEVQGPGYYATIGA